LDAVLQITEILEQNGYGLNQAPFGEPQLGRRGLYGAIGGDATQTHNQMALLWVLNLSDGKHSLLDVAERSGLEFRVVRGAARALMEKGLLSELCRGRNVGA
jgi:aminopeptidase-like protein